MSDRHRRGVASVAGEVGQLGDVAVAIAAERPRHLTQDDRRLITRLLRVLNLAIAGCGCNHLDYRDAVLARSGRQ